MGGNNLWAILPSKARKTSKTLAGKAKDQNSETCIFRRGHRTSFATFLSTTTSLPFLEIFSSPTRNRIPERPPPPLLLSGMLLAFKKVVKLFYKKAVEEKKRSISELKVCLLFRRRHRFLGAKQYPSCCKSMLRLKDKQEIFFVPMASKHASIYIILLLLYILYGRREHKRTIFLVYARAEFLYE